MHLRVALIQAGRIVEDRTFAGRSTITVGSAPDCTFIVPMADVPNRATVFEQTRAGTTLHFSRDADGKVSLGDGEKSFDQLAATAIPRGAGFTVSLNDKSRGRIAIGEVSLLFQFVQPGTQPTPAPLPKGAKGLLAQIDRSFLLILGLSLAAHFAGVGWISSQPIPVERDLAMDEADLDRFARAILPPPKVKKTETTVPRQNERETRDEPAIAKRPAVKQETQAEMKERVRKLGIAGIIGSRGDHPNGALGDILADSSGVNDVAKAIAEAGGMNIATADDATASKRKGPESGETSTIELPGTEGVREVKLTERASVKVNAEVDTGVIESGPELPEDALAKWLRARAPAVQSCYERELKRQPTLAGRLVVRFDITARGRVDRVAFGDDTLRSQAVNVCISNLMRAWVLPFQPDESVPVSLPFIFSASR